MNITGNYNTAVIYADTLEGEAIETITELCNMEAFKDSKIRIMPDVHAGKGCVIGTTMTYADKIVPNIVGVDIGCGMLVIPIIKSTEIDPQKIIDALHLIPSGRNVWENDRERTYFDDVFPEFKKLKCYDELKNKDYLRSSLGTLGGGNHFVEIDYSQKENLFYCVIHTGSRNLGYQVANIYSKIAIKNCNGNTLKEMIDNRIKILKSEGREREIEEAIKQVKVEAMKEFLPDELCYLEGEDMENYLHDMVFCQKFAKMNREYLALKLNHIYHDTFSMGQLFDFGPNMNYDGSYFYGGYHVIHNYVDTEEKMIRKGAISAKKGEPVLIPLNMRDGCIVGKGRGNGEWNNSAPHGAGRVMSRKKARETLNLQEYGQEMRKVYTDSVCMETIDEAPMAYKPMETIVDKINGIAIDIEDRIVPYINFKATE